MSRIATVIGATGSQGSSVVDALIEDGTFTVRAVSRDPSSAAAMALKARGVEVVRANVQDLSSLREAFRGSECVFAVTKPYLAANSLNEYEMGKNMVDASKDVGVNLFVWSSLPNASKLSGGKYTKVKHFDDKAAVDDYLLSSGLPHTIILTGYFLENLWKMRDLQPAESGEGYILKVPVYPANQPQLFTWVKKDVGPSVLAIMKNYRERPAEVIGQKFVVGIARISHMEYADILSKGIGKPVQVEELPTFGREELDQMMKFESEFGIFHEVQTFPDPRLAALGVKPNRVEDVVSVLQSRL